MRIGIDFDNTIVCYDSLFYRVALERGLIPEDLPPFKEQVRDHLRGVGREDAWTAMQGYVYGPRLAEAEPFPGVLDFLRRCRAGGVQTWIVSHKTRVPYRGPAYDLHAAALGWMETHGLFDPAGGGLDRDRVFLEPTKAAKLARIGELACSHFIDDLPEFLAEAAFPAGVIRLLFAPKGACAAPSMVACPSWEAVTRLVLDGKEPDHA